MSENQDWAIKIKRTITLTQTITSRSYPDMTREQAVAYEQDLTKQEKIENFAEGLEYSTEDQIELSEEITAEG